jgi:protein gp37
MRFAERFRGVPGHPYEQGFDLKLWPERLELPLKWRQPKRIFVNSMSDLFHKDIPYEYILQVFDTMHRADWHNFQILTKRSSRVAKLASKLPWPDNVWIGTSIESNQMVDRADHIRKVPAAVRFISAEPLLGPLPDLNLERIDWLIAGGESGHGARPCNIDWIRDLRDRCNRSDVAFFFKQWGGRTPKAGGRILDGVTWDEFPTVPDRDLVGIAA